MASETRPILIAGAGPCGLVAALTLQQQGIPFKIFERATRDKLCSNAGAGFDLFPVAVNILCSRLGLKQELLRRLTPYAGWHMMDLEGNAVRDVKMSEFFTSDDPDECFLSAKRTDLQHVLLDALERPDEVLRRGVQVTGYEQGEDKVTVSLSDGTHVQAAALFACDGIHSAVRRCMFSNEPDELSFTGQVAWWAQVPVTPELEAELSKTQPFQEQGGSFVWALGTSRRPGSFMGGKSDGTFIYAFFSPADQAPAKSSSDLTRRGGVTLSESTKEELLALVAGSGALVTTAIRLTAAEDITMAGLFDRANLDLPYARGRVALLGDAAHPQSPFMGQGVNMAIADAYVLSMRCAKQPIGAAIAAYDTAARRNGVNAVVKGARSYGQHLTSSNWFTCWLIWALMRFLPLSWTTGDMLNADKPNLELVAALDNDLGGAA